MNISPRWFALPVLLLGGLGLLAPTMVGAAGPPDGFRIRDEGKFFSKDALDKAEAVIATIKKEFRQDLLVETFAALPETLKARYNEKDKKAFFESWARERYNREGVAGVSILLSKQPRYLQIEVGKDTEKRAFTSANRQELFKVITEEFKQDDFDKGLLAGVNFVRTTLEKNVGKSAAGATGATTSPRVTRTDKTTEAAEAVQAMGPLGWICIGLAVLMVLWVVIGLFRAMTGGRHQVPPGGYPAQYGRGGPPPGYGPGGPPPGYIPPPGYGQPAPSGGGFLQGMLGGMLGGAAGMWAYDQFFRGGSSPSMTPPAYGGTSPTPDNSAGGGTGGDWGGGGTADTGGGDWGGGGSADTGGGDWGGGGGDTGGGGDWGGGGGDSGGGGDW